MFTFACINFLDVVQLLNNIEMKSNCLFIKNFNWYFTKPSLKSGTAKTVPVVLLPNGLGVVSCHGCTAQSD